MNTTSWANKRREKRVALEMITLPFLATRDEDQQPFEYILMDVSPSGAKFAIPQWVVSRERLSIDCVINMHLPLLHEGSNYTKGKVVWVERDETAFAEICAVRLFQKTSAHSPLAISAESAAIVADMENIGSLSKFLAKTLKDCFLLKKGVAIYLKHLIPYFSRIGGYSETDYPLLKETVLNQIRDRVLANHAALYNLQIRISTEYREEKELARVLNLEELRAMVESEINPDIFTATFESEKIAPYISAIKELEKKLYGNYNTAVMIYLLSL